MHLHTNPLNGREGSFGKQRKVGVNVQTRRPGSTNDSLVRRGLVRWTRRRKGQIGTDSSWIAANDGVIPELVDGRRRTVSEAELFALLTHLRHRPSLCFVLIEEHDSAAPSLTPCRRPAHFGLAYPVHFSRILLRCLLRKEIFCVKADFYCFDAADLRLCSFATGNRGERKESLHIRRASVLGYG